jgi:hypothetical protein
MRWVRFKFCCNILISGNIIKQMPGSGASGTSVCVCIYIYIYIYIWLLSIVIGEFAWSVDGIKPTGDSQNTQRNACPRVTLSTTYPSVVRQGVINCNNDIIPYTWYRHRPQFLVFRYFGCSSSLLCYYIVKPCVSNTSVIAAVSGSQYYGVWSLEIYSYIGAVWHRIPKMWKEWVDRAASMFEIATKHEK